MAPLSRFVKLRPVLLERIWLPVRYSDRTMSADKAAGLDDDKRRELADLHLENEQLRAELAELREQRRQVGRLALASGSFAARIFAGRELTRVVRRWFEAKTLAVPLPVEETADVAAAVVRRWLRVGLWHLALSLGGVITAGILIGRASSSVGR